MTADERRLLELLAASSKGATEALLLVHGFTPEVIVNSVRAKFATLTAEHMPAGDGTVDVTRVRITDAGRRALA